MTTKPTPWWVPVLIAALGDYYPKPLDFTGLSTQIRRLENITAGTSGDTKPTKKENTMSDQDSVNAFVARLSAATDAIRAEIAALQAANPALDLTGLEAAVGGVEGLEPPVVTPPAE